MKRSFKIIVAIVLVVAIFIVIKVYNVLNEMKRQRLAKEHSEFIIEHLDDPRVFNQFPQDRFSKEVMTPFFEKMGKECDWQHRDGKFVDFYLTKMIGPGLHDKIAFIYEYYLKCDSLRFIFVYDLEKPEPELINFGSEPLETENRMIIFPEKQLKNRKSKTKV